MRSTTFPSRATVGRLLRGGGKAMGKWKEEDEKQEEGSWENYLHELDLR